MIQCREKKRAHEKSLKDLEVIQHKRQEFTQVSYREKFIICQLVQKVGQLNYFCTMVFIICSLISKILLEYDKVTWPLSETVIV